MKLIAFGLILICSHVWAIEIDVDFEETYGRTKLENFLENFKYALRNGDTSLGVLDPFTAKELPIKYSQNEPTKINFEALFTNVKVNGLSSYTVNSANFKLFGLKVNLDLSWPLIYGSTNYSVKGNVASREVDGQGGMNGTARNFRFQTDIKLVLKGRHAQIKQMTTKISLQSLDFHETGLYNYDDAASEVLSKKISDTVPKFIITNQKLVVDNVNHVIMQTVNDYLYTITLKDLLKMLGL